MLNKSNRDENKSKGPWGMYEYDFLYRRKGDSVKRSRFISAPSEKGATEQFNFIMKKDGVEAEILEVKKRDV
jgi:hypothetical protein